MRRYKANVKFGPWRPGDEFESADPLHAALAQGAALDDVTEEVDGDGHPAWEYVPEDGEEVEES